MPLGGGAGTCPSRVGGRVNHQHLPTSPCSSDLYPKPSAQSPTQNASIQGPWPRVQGPPTLPHSSLRPEVGQHTRFSHGEEMRGVSGGHLPCTLQRDGDPQAPCQDIRYGRLQRPLPALWSPIVRSSGGPCDHARPGFVPALAGLSLTHPGGKSGLPCTWGSISATKSAPDGAPQSSQQSPAAPVRSGLPSSPRPRTDGAHRGPDRQKPTCCVHQKPSPDLHREAAALPSHPPAFRPSWAGSCRSQASPSVPVCPGRTPEAPHL